MRSRLALAAAAAALALGTSGAPASADVIRVQSTTDTVDAGLVDGLLRSAYAAVQPGDELQYTAVGTGKALDNARAGLADVVITHAPSLEARFVADGFSADAFGRQIFYSDYVIVGPRSDPAGVLAAHPHDAVGAFEDISAAGDGATASFVSRGDNSGTNVQEQILWGLTTIAKQAASNGSGNAERFEPGTGGVYPPWYKQSSKGQAASLQEADVCPAATYPNGGCYTMVDRGTFNRLINAGTITNLRIVSERNLPAARGGENLLINPFSAYVLNPDRFADGSKPNVAAARRFVEFLTSPAFQQAVEGFPSAVDPAFRPDAFAAVTLDSPLPPAAAPGAVIQLAGTVSNRLPGASAVKGLAVQLQRTQDGGSTWTGVGAPAPTDAAGRFAVSVTPQAGTAVYRLVLPAFATTPYNGFTASVQPLGPVTVLADTAKPAVTGLEASRNRVTLTLSEDSALRVTIKRRTVRTVRRNGRPRQVVALKTVKTFTVKSADAGTVTRRFHALEPARYRIAVQATDASGNRRTVTRAFRVGKR